ncbi:hypothetical protein CPB86DRAFT_725099 [Serendipita vermifera]|nr:hypothetical protein CPB86DRAFT_725099 [Serendipita vermifera]
MTEEQLQVGWSTSGSSNLTGGKTSSSKQTIQKRARPKNPRISGSKKSTDSVISSFGDLQLTTPVSERSERKPIITDESQEETNFTPFNTTSVASSPPRSSPSPVRPLSSPSPASSKPAEPWLSGESTESDSLRHSSNSPHRPPLLGEGVAQPSSLPKVGSASGRPTRPSNSEQTVSNPEPNGHSSGSKNQRPRETRLKPSSTVSKDSGSNHGVDQSEDKMEVSESPDKRSIRHDIAKKDNILSNGGRSIALGGAHVPRATPVTPFPMSKSRNPPATPRAMRLPAHASTVVIIPQGPIVKQVLIPAEADNFKPRTSIAQGFHNVNLLEAGSRMRALTIIQSVRMKKIPELITGIPLCPQGCFQLTNSGDQSGSKALFQPGMIGCTHTYQLHTSCLSQYLPKDVPRPSIDVTQFHPGTRYPMKRLPHGASVFAQATQMTTKDTELRWVIIPPSQTAAVTFISIKLGMDLEQGSLFVTDELLQNAIKEGIVIYECFQRVGEMVHIPAGSLYQAMSREGDSTVTMWYTYTISGLADAFSKDLYLSHRICLQNSPPVRKMVYHYLHSIQKEIERNVSCQTILDKYGGEEVVIGLQLLDQILFEEYTGESDEFMTHIGQCNSCDFCGADLFHAVFACSSLPGEPQSSSLPQSFCEVHLCPWCCAEGRSCLCRNLRLCVTSRFDDLLAMRNTIREWLAKSNKEFPRIRELTISDLQDDMSQAHVTRGAISVLYIRRLEEKREKPAVGKVRTTSRCKAGERNCDEHDVLLWQGVTCSSPDCRETICFRHLLSVGFHSWEAAFRWQYEKNWHKMHTDWSQKWIDWSSVPDYKPIHVEDQIVWCASTLPNCNPRKPESLRLGFYDSAPTQASRHFAVDSCL